ncbi:MAG: glycosyltransferase, partial [Actinomycetota bacterium]
MREVRFVCDQTWTRVGSLAILAGSPHRLFRLTPAGDRVVRSIERSDELGAELVGTPLVRRLLDAGAIHPAPLRPEDRVVVSVADVSVVTPQLGGVVAPDGRITVDDASDPPLVGATIRLERNLGPSGARNAGRRVVTTSFVLFVDADVDVPELDPDHPCHDAWWRSLLRHFADPQVGLVA